MAHPPGPAIVGAELQQLLQGVATDPLDRANGPDGVPWGTEFADLDDGLWATSLPMIGREQKAASPIGHP